MLTVTRSVRIDRPVREVQAQFSDVAHHERTVPHRSARFTVLDRTSEDCAYAQVSRVGLGRVRQTFRLDARDPARQVNTVIDGPFRTGTITFAIEPSGPRSSTVTATLAAPAGRLLRLLVPVLVPLLGRSLAAALVEDKHDLESGAYARTLDP